MISYPPRIPLLPPNNKVAKPSGLRIWSSDKASSKRGETCILTRILSCQASIGGHADKEDVLARILLELDILLAIEGEGSILTDGACHPLRAIHLECDTNNHNDAMIRQTIIPNICGLFLNSKN